MLAHVVLRPVCGQTTSHKVKGDVVKTTLCPEEGGAVDYVVSDQVWAHSKTVESALQTAIKELAPMFNGLSQRTIFYDFSINGKQTLGDYKPDGHGRTQSSAEHQLNVLQQAVLVELKVKSQLKLDNSKGNALSCLGRGLCR